MRASLIFAKCCSESSEPGAGNALGSLKANKGFCSVWTLREEEDLASVGKTGQLQLEEQIVLCAALLAHICILVYNLNISQECFQMVL